MRDQWSLDSFQPLVDSNHMTGWRECDRWRCHPIELDDEADSEPEEIEPDSATDGNNINLTNDSECT